MRPSPGTTHKLSTEQQLYLSAQRALMRRAHSIHEMHEYLARRADDASQIPGVIARLRELRYLDDARYALNYAQSRVHSHHGRFRISRELRARGVPTEHIDAALTSVFAETDEASLVRARLKRRLAHVRPPLDRRKLASLYRSLLAAGFSADIIRAELKNVTTADLPDLEPTPPSES